MNKSCIGRILFSYRVFWNWECLSSLIDSCVCGCECWFLHFSPCWFICVGDMPWSLSPECIQRVLNKERWGRGISGCDLSHKCRQPSLFRPIQVGQGVIRSRPPCFWYQWIFKINNLFDWSCSLCLCYLKLPLWVHWAVLKVGGFLTAFSCGSLGVVG